MRRQAALILAVVGLVLAAPLGEVPPRRFLDLHALAGATRPAGALVPSQLAPVQWHPGTDRLRVDLGAVGRWDRLKLRLRSERPAEPVEVLLDGTGLARAVLVPEWRELVLRSPRAGRWLELRRRPDAGAIHVARVAVVPMDGWVSGLVEAAVLYRPRAPRLPRSARGTALLVALGAALGLILVGRLRGLVLAVALAPATAVAAAVLSLHLASPWRLVYPLRTPLLLLALPLAGVAASVAVRHAPAAAGRLRRGSHSRIGRAGAAVLLVGWLAWIVLSLPRSPFEWDEILFLDALDRYDVLAHAPHPPGYPVFVALGTAVRALAGDPVLALQLVSVAGAGLALVATALLVRRLGGGALPAVVAAALLAPVPAFAFHAGVGLSDALGAGISVLAVLLAVRALEQPRVTGRLAATAAVAALALGVRPQLGIVLAPVGLWLVAASVRCRAWRSLAVATVVGAVVSAAVWLPAVLLTGWDRFRDALSSTAEWVAAAEAGYRLPGAPLGEALESWLVRPFGGAAPATLLWMMVGLGAVTWWHTGHRRLVAVAGLSGGVFLVTAAFTMSLTTAPRYVLPALPFAAVLAAGGVSGRRSRPAAVLAALATGAMMVAHVAPPMLLRARDEAPVSRMLRRAAELTPPGGAVAYGPSLAPHAKRLLPRIGRRPVPLDDPSAELAVVTPWEREERPVVHEVAWTSEALRRLTRRRYDHALVVLQPTAPQRR